MENLPFTLSRWPPCPRQNATLEVIATWNLVSIFKRKISVGLPSSQNWSEYSDIYMPTPDSRFVSELQEAKIDVLKIHGPSIASPSTLSTITYAEHININLCIVINVECLIYTLLT